MNAERAMPNAEGAMSNVRLSQLLVVVIVLVTDAVARCGGPEES